MQSQKIVKLLLVVTSVIIISCESLLKPEPENYYNESMLVKDMPFAEGILVNALKIGGNYPQSNSYASDNAVTNENHNPYRRMALGEWSSQFNPVSAWSNAYENIYYLNFFLSFVDDVEWSWQNEDRKEYFRVRYTGEAYGLRAWHSFELLKRHGGKTSDGKLLGYILLDSIGKYSELNLPRSSFEECVQSIYSDIDNGIERLPLDYEDTDDSNYNIVFGKQNKGRVSARILMALKSRVALYAASPAFNSSVEKWENAADVSAELLKQINGIAGLSSKGNIWYTDPFDPEIIWRTDIQNLNSWEANNFPPSLYGNGMTNPTQNLVDAFPMKNGYPISDIENSHYNTNDPYTARDPRLSKYIIFNGNTLGKTIVKTDIESYPDGIDNTINATRTGYYLKKFMDEQINIAPEVNSKRPHFYTLFRYTEIFLNYAEAANEAWGPNADPRGYGFTASSIIGAIRKRGGISQPDIYISSIQTKEEMRILIENERRIELCFEGFRFWDLRRLDMNLNEVAKGISIQDSLYTIVNVEERNYEPYMIYGPIPYTELLKNNELVQNIGW